MKNEVIIEKIIGYAEKIVKNCEKYSVPDDFLSDSILVESCVFNLLQTGELVNNLDNSFTAAHTDIPWRELYGLRNRIVHDYEGINFILVWDVIKLDLPDLILKLKLLQKEPTA